MIDKRVTSWLRVVPFPQSRSSRFRVSLSWIFKYPKVAILLFMAFVIAVSSLSILPITAYAAGPNDTARSKALYNALRACITYEQRNQISSLEAGGWTSIENAKNNRWWNDGNAWFSWSGNPTYRSPSFLATAFDDGRQTCNTILSEGLAAWGFSDGMELLCAANVERIAGPLGWERGSGGSCQNGTGKGFDIGEDDEPAIAKAIRDKAFSGKDINGYTPPEWYAIYYKAFTIGCKATAASTGSGDRDYVDINIVTDDGSGSIVPTRFEGRPKGDKIHPITQSHLASNEETCEEVAKHLSSFSSGYSEWILTNPSTPPGTPLVEDLDPAPDEAQATCNIEGIGWIVCPVMTWIAKLNDAMFEFISGFLAVPPEIFGTDPTKSLYGAWNMFRSWANVAFVVVFLIIIYSQITSAGITNYGVKKMLPKLIVGAILVNASYYICQLAVDLSNLLGYGLNSLFVSVTDGFDGVGAGKSSSISWIDTVGSILSGTVGTVVGAVALTAGAIALAIAVGTPVILAGLLSLAMVALILIARQAIVVLLIAVSPVAFVLYLLPNTEKWFKKWWELLFAMLLLFPIISVLFGAGTLASSILATIPLSKDGNMAGAVMQIAALGASIIPLIATIPLLQGSLKATGALGAKLQGMSSAANKNMGKNLKEKSRIGAYKKSWDRRQQIKRNEIMGGTYRGRSPLARASSWVSRGLNNSRLTGKVGDDVASQAAHAANKLEIESVEAAKAQIEQANLNGDQLRQLIAGGSAGGMRGASPAMRAAAISTAADRGDYAGVREGWDSVRDLRGNSGDETRRAVAGALGRSSNRPTYLGQRALQNMREGTAGSHDAEALASIQQGAYSPEGIAKASNQELEQAQRIAQGNELAEQNIQRAADAALSHSEISKSISKNRDILVTFRDTFRRPPPGPTPVP